MTVYKKPPCFSEIESVWKRLLFLEIFGSEGKRGKKDFIAAVCAKESFFPGIFVVMDDIYWYSASLFCLKNMSAIFSMDF